MIILIVPCPCLINPMIRCLLGDDGTMPRGVWVHEQCHKIALAGT